MISKLIWVEKISVFELRFQGMEDKKMEQKFVEKELSHLMEITIQLEDELNSIINYE